MHQEFQATLISGNSKGFFNAKNRNNRIKLNKKLSRLILNYLSSAIAVIDHNRPIKKMYLDETAMGIFAEYINKAFLEDDKMIFIRNFRNYVLHERTPNLNFAKIITRIHKKDFGDVESPSSYVEVEFSIYIKSDDVKDGKCWPIQIKNNFFREHKKIFLENLLRDYHAKILEGQYFLFKLLFSGKITDLAALLAELQQIEKKAAQINLVEMLPYRRGTIRYINYILSKFEP